MKLFLPALFALGLIMPPTGATPAPVSPHEVFASDYGYRGPVSLGPFRIDGPTGSVSLHRILSAAGIQKITGPGRFVCFENEAPEEFVVLGRSTDDGERVSSVLLSEAQTCFGVELAKSDRDTQWTTDKGIRLGSRASQVLAEYGNPSRQESTAKYGFFFAPGATKKDTARLVAKFKDAIVMGYRPKPDSPDLSAADFGIVDGKVAWIWLSRDE